MSERKRFQIKDVQDRLLMLFDSYGCNPEVGRALADVMIDAELNGTRTHGIRLLPIYLARLNNGTINKNPQVIYSQKFPAIGVLNGDDAPGAYAATKALSYAKQSADIYGMGAVSVIRSSHFGPAGYYARLGADMGLITIVSTNGSSAVAPTGSKQPFFSATPLAVGTPTHASQAMVLDMALTVTARARIRSMAKQGKSIPADWAIDADGKPTTDASIALNGSLLPVGGYKGYGLMFMLEILTAILGGASIGPDIGDLYKDIDRPQRLGHFILAIRADACREYGDFSDSLHDFMARVKSCTPITSDGGILLPGEKENLMRKEQFEYGLELSEEAISELNNELLKAGFLVL